MNRKLHPHAALPLLLSLCACAQAPYALDEDSIAELNGALPDSDPALLDGSDELDEQGYELESRDLFEPGALEGDEVPLAPQLREADVLPTASEDQAHATQGLLFAGSKLSLVSDTTRASVRTTVQLAITWKTGKETVCTGTLIAPDAVLTAAHCVFVAERRGFAYSIAVTPAQQGEDPPPYGRIWVKRSFAPNDYRVAATEWDAYPFDYGVVRLKSSFELEPRALGVGSEALGKAFVVRGYPGNRTTRYDGQHMYESRDKVRSILSDGIFYHRASTIGGMSGAGIDDGSRIIGVHTSGAESDNSGVVFSPTSLDAVRRWAKQAL